MEERPVFLIVQKITGYVRGVLREPLEMLETLVLLRNVQPHSSVRNDLALPAAKRQLLQRVSVSPA
jgi:hypothetical protein